MGKEKMQQSLLSSESYEWSTPDDLFEQIDGEFHFEIDVCATDQNTKCKKWFSPEQDGLLQEWRGSCWMNPPYGSQIKEWMKKAYMASLNGATVVCLVPSRTDARWWHDYAMKGEIRFLLGRVRFSNSKDNAPFPSAIVVFRPNIYQFSTFQQRGLF